MKIVEVKMGELNKILLPRLNRDSYNKFFAVWLVNRSPEGERRQGRE